MTACPNSSTLCGLADLRPVTPVAMLQQMVNGKTGPKTQIPVECKRLCPCYIPGIKKDISSNAMDKIMQ